MLVALTQQQQAWVDTTLAGMTLEQCAGQLLCPMGRGFSTDDWLDLLEQVPLGSLFIRSMPGEALRHMLSALQEKPPIPLVVAGDLEHGALAVAHEGTVFPLAMAGAWRLTPLRLK